MGLGRWTVLFVGVVGLACGGMGGDDVKQAVHATCGSAELQPSTVDLVLIEDTSLRRPKLSVQLEVHPDGLRLDGESMADGSAVGERLRIKAETARDLADKIGSADFAFRGELLLLLPPDTPSGTLLPLLEVAHASGFPHVRFVVRTGKKPSTAFVDGAYGMELAARLDGLAPADRARVLAEEIEDLLVACPSGQQAFAAVAHASAEMKCQLMAVGLAEALPMCPLTNHGKVVTAVQVATDGSPWTHGVLALSLDPEGTPYPIDPSTPWSELATRWAADGTEDPTWWVDEGAASPE